MANEDEVSSPITDFTYDELHTAFYDLLAEYKKAGIKYKSLKHDHDILVKERDNVLEENTILQSKLNNVLNSKIALQYTEKIKSLEEENEILRKDVNQLKPLVDKLTLSSNKLELILRTQKDSTDKAGIGYNSEIQPIHPAKLVNASKEKASKITIFKKDIGSRLKCFKCGKLGHKSFDCNIKKTTKSKKIWVPKGTTATNLKGPKKTWVPKIAT